jgi:hypothetical protein
MPKFISHSLPAADVVTKKAGAKGALENVSSESGMFAFLVHHDEHYHRVVFVLNNEIESNWKNKLNA